MPSISPIAIFCDELRVARDFRHSSVEDIAELTKIRVDYLRAIEEARWDEVPAAYLRGYIALYARAIGLNDEKVLKQFDAIAHTPVTESAAEIDSTVILSPRPQLVELPRAKIRVAWFAALMRNRKLSYSLAAVLIILWIGGVMASREEWRTQVYDVDLDEALSGSQARLYAPYTRIGPDSSTLQYLHNQNRFSTVYLIAFLHGKTIFRIDSQQPQARRYAPYDTIKFQYFTGVLLTVTPAATAVLFDDEFKLIPTNRVSADSSYFSVGSPTISIESNHIPQLNDSVSG